MIKKTLLFLGDQVFKNKKTYLLFWFFILISSCLILFFVKKDNLETEISGFNNGEASYVKKILDEDFDIKLGSSSAIFIEGSVETNEIKKDLTKLVPEIYRFMQIRNNNEHKNTLIYIEFDKKYPYTEINKLTPKIRDYLKTWQEKNNLKSYYTGNAAFQYDSKESSKKDSLIGESFALLISFFILILTFGGIVSALLPLLIGATTLVFLSTIIKILGLSVNYISQILSGLTGLALATDYSLFIVSRFKEEILVTTEEKSIRNTIFYSGRTIFYSGLIMICSVSALFLPDISITRSVVISVTLVILISLINSVVFLPNFILLLKKHLDKPLFLSKLITNSKKEAFWRKFSTQIVKRPKFYFTLSLFFLLILATPVLNIKLWSPVINIAPQDSESIQGYELLQKDGWGGQLVPVSIIVRSDKRNSVYSAEFISYVYDLTKNLEKHSKVESVQSITSFNKNFTKQDYIYFLNSVNNFSFIFNINPLINTKTGNNETLINIFPKNLIDLNDSFEILDSIKEYRLKNDKFKVFAGGLVARINEFTTELYAYVPEMILIIFSGIYILLYFYMGSIILPIKAGIMNFLPILSSFGLITLIFQYGYFHSFLKTPFNHAVTNIVPIVLFCVVFGLSMDYEVLILSRITESYEKNNDVNTAIIEGMAKSGSLITGASLILIGVFLPGIFSSSPQIKEICLGMSSAILIDATIVRLFLVPSFMTLMGKWNWWNPLRK